MDLDNSIKGVFSCKSYLSKNVSDKDIAKVLNSARYASSSGNMQNWRFIVIRDAKTKEKISRFCLEQLWIQEAPVIIVVCSDNSNLKTHYPKRWRKYCRENCAAASENILIKSTSLGLSSCWVRSFSEPRLKNLLKIPDSVSVEAVITLGYSSDKLKEPKHSPEEVTFFEKYGNRRRDTSIFPLAKHIKKLKK